MKQYTTPEQTAKLIELWLPQPRTKIPFEVANDELGYTYSIGELIEVLPENIAKQDEMPSTLNISLMNGEWCVYYADFLGTDFEFCNTELIEALYDMAVRLKERSII